MPQRDQYGRIGGFLEIEEMYGGWRRRFVLLDESKLKFFKGKDSMEASIEDEPLTTIDLAYITKVAITTAKPKAQYCFEIHTASEKWYLSSTEESEIEEWFKVLHKAAVNPKSGDEKGPRNIERKSGSVKSLGSNDGDDVTYETKIIGGVPVRIAKTMTGDSNSMIMRNNSDSMKPIKIGYCVKQGAVVSGHIHSVLKYYFNKLKTIFSLKVLVMKNWKRRYFKLDMFKFCYYEKETDKEPIRSLSATDLKGVKPHTGTTFQNKQHVFEVETPQRTYYIQAESHEEMEAWIKAFKQVIRSIKGKSTVDSVSNVVK